MTMTEQQAIIIAALIGVIGTILGFAGGLIVARYTIRQKADELFLDGLQYLGGGSQVRNLGIAALDLAWESERHRKYITPLIVGSALYLLLESRRKDAAHEIYNLRRLVKLLIAAKNSGDLSLEDEQTLCQAIDTKLSAQADENLAAKLDKHTGLVLDVSDLTTWQSQLGKAR